MLRAGLRSFSTTSKRMVPAPTYVAARAEKIESLVSQGWSNAEKGYLSKKFQFKGFKSAWSFMEEVAQGAMQVKRESQLCVLELGSMMC